MLIWFIICVCLCSGTTVSGFLSIQKSYLLLYNVHNYVNYGDVQMFEHFVPEMTLKVNWRFQSKASPSECPLQNITVMLQHGSYPLPESENNKTYPDDFYLRRTSPHTIRLTSGGNITQMDTIQPTAGQWFAIAFIPHRKNNDVIQTITDLDCRYDVVVNITTVFLLNLPEIVHDTKKDITFNNIGEYRVFRYFVEANVWHYDVIVDDCVDESGAVVCPVEIAAASGALPGDENTQTAKCDQSTNSSSCTLTVFSPVVSRWHYLMIKGNNGKQMNATVRVVMQGCSLMLTLSSSVSTKPKSSVSEAATTTRVTDNIMNTDTEQNSVVTEQIMTITEQTIRVTDHAATDSLVTATDANTTEQATTVTTPAATSTTTTDTTPTPAPSPNICGPINTLYRVEDMSTVDYAVYSLGPESFTQVLVVSPRQVTLVQFNVLPVKDSGGTLTYRALISEFAFNPNNTQNVTVKMCLSPFRIPANNSQYYCSPDGATEVLLDTGEDDSLIATRRIPYPEPGLYFVGIQSYCYVLREAPTGELIKVYQPCVEDFTQVVFQVLNGPCANATCAHQGECRTYKKGAYVFSSCKCYAKYRGYTCEDDSEAKSRSIQMLYTCLLSLSNLAFVPAVVVAVYRRYYVEAVVYFSNMFFSGFYHACDMHPWSVYTLCIMPYHVLSYCDFLLSITSFWVTLMAMAELPPVIVSILHMFGVVAFAMGVEWAQHSTLMYVLPITVAVMLVVTMWVLRSVQMHKCYPDKRRWFYIIPGFVAAATGLIIFAFLENDDNYPYTHSVWHMTIASSIVFLLPQREMQTCLGKDSDQSSDEFEFDDRNNIYHIQSDASQLVEGDLLRFT